MLIPMKKAILYALKSDQEKILLALQKTGEFMLVPTQEDQGLPGKTKLEQDAQRVDSVIKVLTAHDKNKKLFEQKVEVGFTDFLKENHDAVNITKEIETFSEQITKLKNEILTLNSQIENLKPWEQLSERLSSLIDSEYTRIFIGFVPEDKLPFLQQKLSALICNINTYEKTEDGQAIFIVCHNDDAQVTYNLLKESNFSESRFVKSDMTAKEQINKLDVQIQEKLEQIEDFKKKIEARTDQKEQIKKLYDKYLTDFERLLVKGEETVQTFFVTGWVRYDKQEQVTNAVSSFTDAYAITFDDPDENDHPPSVTVNAKLIEPYQAVTNLYSRPLATGIDPNPIMAPFYFVFFGMMVSDAGYGIILTILLLIIGRMIKLQGMAGQLTKVILMGGISTVIWGAMFGGWFGIELKPLLFSPMKEPIKMLILCYILGTLHIFVGMFIKMYMQIKVGKTFDAIVDQLSWVVMLSGLILLVALPDMSIGKYFALAGMATILLFAGRGEISFVKRILGGVTSLYGATSYLSDVLSYSRLFALGLATGVIAMVINTIASMIWQAGIIGQIAAIAVLLVGHTFNIAINVLGAYVHTSRLQFIEFFSKFYEPGGKEFRPLAFRTKYVNITK